MELVELVRGWWVDGGFERGVCLMRALLRAKNTFLHFYSATSFVPVVHSSIPLVGQTKSPPPDTHTYRQSLVLVLVLLLLQLRQ